MHLCHAPCVLNFCHVPPRLRSVYVTLESHSAMVALPVCVTLVSRSAAVALRVCCTCVTLRRDRAQCVLHLCHAPPWFAPCVLHLCHVRNVVATLQVGALTLGHVAAGAPRQPNMPDNAEFDVFAAGLRIQRVGVDVGLPSLRRRWSVRWLAKMAWDGAPQSDQKLNLS